MKCQSPKDYLTALVSFAPPEEQQALRAELKSLQLSPQLAALIAQRLETVVRETKPVAPDAGVVAKLDNILARIAAVEKHIESTPVQATGNDPKVTATITEEVQGLRDDMRGVQNHLIANRPLSWTKVFFVAFTLLLVGGAAGWYARREYRLWQYEQLHGGSQK